MHRKSIVSLVVSLLALNGCALIDFDRRPPRGSDLSGDRTASVTAPTKSGLSGLPGKGIPLPAPEIQDTPEVRNEIQVYLKGNARSIAKAIQKRDEHFDTLKQIFSDEGVPLELINLALIESGFCTDARSPAGAVGMWQFTRPTAKSYGLRVERGVDQRTDVIRSTFAAVRHLKDLYRMHGDWNFVLAAYNAGSGAVSVARKKYGGEDFWTIARRGGFSAQTRRFVPKFMAATVLVQALEAHGTENLKDNAFALLRAGRESSTYG